MISPISGSHQDQPVINPAGPLVPASSVNIETPVQSSQTFSNVVGAKGHLVAQTQLDETLKDTGFKGEIDTSNPLQVVVRIVDDATGATVIQIPSVSALALAVSLRKATVDGSQPSAGAIIDASA